MKCTISKIYLTKYSTCFGQVYCPSSAVSQNCNKQYMIVLLASASRCQQNLLTYSMEQSPSWEANQVCS